MVVGVLTIELAIFDARTLKDKRRVIHGIKQRLRNQFNVSVTEVGYTNTPKRCQLGIAMVSGASRPLHSQLDRIVDVIRRTTSLTLVNYEREVL